MSTARLFVAVDPPPPVRERLGDAIERARPLAPRAKWADVATLHLTIAFLGDVEETRIDEHARALGEAALRHAAFDLRIASAGTLGGRRARVLHANVGGALEALAALQRDVVAALLPLGFVPEARPFVPHLTLARARAPGGEPRFSACVDALADADFGAVPVDAVVLYRSVLGSAGATHTPVATLPLGAR